jgi:cell division protein FtsB
VAKPGKKRKWRTMLYLTFWLFVAGVFAGAIAMQAAGYNRHRRALNQALADLAQEKKTYENLLAEMAFYESDAYLEQLAREQLGLIKPDEMVFINIAD